MNSSGRRVLQLRSGAGFFGAENVVLELAKGLKTTTYPSTIGVLKNAHSNWRALSVAAENQGIPTVEFQCRGAFDISTIAAVRRFVTEHEIGIVHSHGYKANLYARAATRGLSVARVATCHPWTEVAYSLKARFYTRIDQAVLRGFDKLVAVSDAMRSELLTCRLPDKKISVIPNGIDTSRFTKVRDARALRAEFGIPQHKIVVGTIGRLVPEKAQSLLIDAARGLKTEFSNVVYVFVGDGPLRRDLELQSRIAGVESDVIFTGVSDRIPEALDALDVFVLPSISEGLPMVILEAMAAGKPIVASKVGAIPSVLTHGETGLLIEPNAIDLAQAISQLLKNPGEAARLARNACSQVRANFSSHAMTTSYTQLYASMLGAN